MDTLNQGRLPGVIGQEVSELGDGLVEGVLSDVQPRPELAQKETWEGIVTDTSGTVLVVLTGTVTGHPMVVESMEY